LIFGSQAPHLSAKNKAREGVPSFHIRQGREGRGRKGEWSQCPLIRDTRRKEKQKEDKRIEPRNRGGTQQKKGEKGRRTHLGTEKTKANLIGTEALIGWEREAKPVRKLRQRGENLWRQKKSTQKADR